MNKPNESSRNLGQDARLIMHEDEHAIVREILMKTLGDDGCFARVVSSDRSESGRAQDRLVLARFFERMERQFALRAQARSDREDRRTSASQRRMALAASEARPNGSGKLTRPGAAG